MGDIHLWATYLIIALTVAAYASDRFALETVALASLAALLTLFALAPGVGPQGPLPPEALLAGFANPALVTVLALLIVGQGLFATDAMDGPARMVSRLSRGSGKRALAITLVAAASLSAVFNNTPVVVIFIPVLFTPIALSVADAVGAPPAAFLACVIFAANASFATPIGYQTNLLVMGPGRYGFRDFLKAGIPLVVLLWLTFTLVAPAYYGL